MNRYHLGDSYDAVKRLWHNVFEDWAPLYANPDFLPEDLRDEFATLTGISVLPDQRPRRYSVLNDPDTGIRLPEEENQTEWPTHITVATIIQQLQDERLRCVVTFDQSNYRRCGRNRNAQLQEKLASLEDGGRFGFYYVSHAPFLFAFRSKRDRRDLQRLLRRAGLAAGRFELE